MSTSGPGPSTRPKLKLGPNERYRGPIELAAARTGIDPAVIAAIVSAEAAPLWMNTRHRVQVTDELFLERFPERRAKPLDPREPSDAPLIEEWKALYAEQRDGWDERAAPPRGSARGATQFLERTWLGEAQRPGTYLNEEARRRGLVDAEHRLVAGRTAELLELRFDNTVCVVAAAEYDAHELAGLQEAEPLLVPREMTDRQRAQYLYLVHHEGGEGAGQILSHTLGDSRALVLLASNVPDPAAREALLVRHGSPAAAYQAWIRDYLERRIQPDRFREPSVTGAEPPPVPHDELPPVEAPVPPRACVPAHRGEGSSDREVETAAGRLVVENHGAPRLLLDGRTILEEEPFWLLEIAAALPEREPRLAVIALVRGGSGCGVMYRVVDLGEEGLARTSAPFGTCHDLSEACYEDGVLRLRFAERDQQRPRAWVYREGRLSEEP